MNPTRDFSEALLAFHASCSLETILRILEWPSTAGRFAVRIKRTEIAQRGGEEVDCCLVQCSGRVIALRGQTSGQEGVKPLEDAASKMTVIPIVLCLLCGIFSGTFTVALHLQANRNSTSDCWTRGIFGPLDMVGLGCLPKQTHGPRCLRRRLQSNIPRLG